MTAFGDFQLEIYLAGLQGVLPSFPMAFAELEARAERALPPSVLSYVAGGAGSLEAFAQKSADEYQSLGKIATAEGARTALFVPDLNRIYLAVPHKGGNAQAEVRVYTVE